MRNLSTILFTAVATMTLVGAATAGDDTSKGKAPVKADVKADAKVKAPEPAPVAMPAAPTPAPELLAAAKAMKGTWSCKGDMFKPDGTSYKSKATMKQKLALDKMWIQGDFAESKTKASPKPMKFTSFRTYDAAGKKWLNVMLDNWGGIGKGWSTGPDAAGKTTFETEASMMGQTYKGRDYEEKGPKKNSLHVWGEYSMDGKTYNKAYDMICTK